MAKLDLVFDLNELLRNGESWYPDNAHKLMEYTVKKGYKVAGWELGNGKSRSRVFELLKFQLLILQVYTVIFFVSKV